MKRSITTCLRPKLVLTEIFISAFLAINVLCDAAEPTTSVSGDEALKKLTDGNARFVSGKRESLDAAKRRAEVAKEQKPFAVIVSCSDSRVPPELVFDQGLGDIFVIRTAGEVLDSAAIGSIEYAVEHVGVRLIVVLGHQRCGAVAAAVSGAQDTGQIVHLIKAIQPAVEEVKGKPGDALDNAVHAQALDVVKKLQTTDPIISESFQSGKLSIVGGYYSLDSGKVDFLKP